MRRAVVAILGVAVLALLVARYARELIDVALRLPLIVLDITVELLRGLQAVVQRLLTDAGPFLAPIGDALGGILDDPAGSVGALIAWAGDLVTSLIIAARDAVIDWWTWAADHPETVTVVLFWALVGIAGVAFLRRRSRASRPRRRRRDA